MPFPGEYLFFVDYGSSLLCLQTLTKIVKFNVVLVVLSLLHLLQSKIVRLSACPSERVFMVIIYQCF